MKLTWILFTVMALISRSTFADEFAAHPVPTPTMVCKKLDFDSHFKAQNSKQNILRTNPVLDKPNFAGKYLLLKNELMMEVQWLIASCETGKFFKATLYGQPDFKAGSNLVILPPELSKNKTESDELPTLKLWVDEKWEDTVVTESATKSAPLENTNPAGSPVGSLPAPTPAGSTDVLQKYTALFPSYPETVDNSPCKPLQYDTYFRAQQSKSTIKKYNLNLAQANFAGHYLLLKNEMLFDQTWLIADCRTGKFFAEQLSGKGQFKPDSNLMIITDSGSAPALYTWTDGQWIQISNPLAKNKPKISNTFYAQNATLIMSAFPDQNKNRIVRFESLDCSTEVQKNCTPELVKLLKPFSGKVKSGHCTRDKNPPTCELETE